MTFKIKDILKMVAAPFIVFMVSNYFDQFTDIYRALEWPNRVAHFCGGVSISVPIYFVLKWAKANKFISTSSKWIDFILIVMSAMCIASLWEFHEYFHDKFFPGQFLAQPSVDDTMKDMIMGMLGSIFFVLVGWISGFFKEPQIIVAATPAKKKGNKGNKN